MRRLLVSTLALAAMASTAFAQQPPAPAAPAEPPAPPKAQDQMPPAPPPPPGPEAATGPDAMWPHDRGGPRGDMGHRRPPPPPPSKAAHFRIEDGSRKIDIKCADDEPTKVCADTLLQIIDKLGNDSDRSDDYRDYHR